MTPNRARSLFLFSVVMVVGLVTLVRTHHYYGGIYRGQDAQFYYAMGHSLVFDQDLDATNNLRLTPYPAPFDQDGDGTWESAPTRSDGRITSKYPLGLSLIEAPLIALGYLVRQAAVAAGVSVSGAVGYSPLKMWYVAIGWTTFLLARYVGLVS